MKIDIEKLDDFGRGIGYIDGKITFVPNTVPGDIVNINIIKEHKKYNEATIDNFIKYSEDRIKPPCPYFTKCGGCTLQNLSYENTINYKLNKLKNIFNKNRIDITPKIISNPNPYNYRNKISLKVVDTKVGFYLNNTHNIIEIDECLIANPAINECINYIKNFNIINGNVIIRCNQNAEILIIIESQDNLTIDIELLKKKIKLVGIIINNKTFYGKNYLFERINNILFKVSYDSFFQVNPSVASKLFQIVKDNISLNDKVLDLYCGVGTLSLNAASKALSVTGIEIVPNAILNALFNASLNDLSNVHFVLNDVSDAIAKIKLDFNKVIVDPPRAGLTKETIDILLKINPTSIIYVSCDPQTLVRDYKLLSDTYEIEKSYILDMFSYTYHVETVLILKKR